MTSITLKFGDRPTTFYRSDRLAAVESAGPAAAGLQDRLPFSLRHRFEAVRDLGRFQIYALEAEATGDSFHAAVAPLGRALPLGPAVTHVYHTCDDEVPFVPTGQVLLKIDPEADSRDLEPLLRKSGLVFAGPGRGPGDWVARVSGSYRDPVAIASELQQDDRLLLAEPDLLSPLEPAFRLPVETLLDQHWHLEDRGREAGLVPGADAQVLAAWRQEESLGSREVVVVAVLDDSFDLGHPDLGVRGKTVSPVSFTGEPSVLSTDPRHGHGTAVASLAVGEAHIGPVVGVSPAARWMPVRVPWCASQAEIAAWFDYARIKGAWVINCSWGPQSRCYPLASCLRDAVRDAAHIGRDGKGTVVCFAAGNHRFDIDDPPQSHNGFAAHPDVIAVSGVGSNDRPYEGTNYGKYIWVAAPNVVDGGCFLITADLREELFELGDVPYAGYRYGPVAGGRCTGCCPGLSGTSASCAIVSGVAALLLAKAPHLTADGVKKILGDHARKLDGQTGRTPHLGHGVVNAEAALAAV